MSCAEPLDPDLLESYLLGRLAPDQRDELEAHVFACPECAERLEGLEALRGALAAGPRRRPWVLGAGAAAALALGLGITLSWPPASPVDAPDPGPTAAPFDLASLGTFEPPAYEPRRLRGGGEAERRFAAGMEAYARGDWVAALTDLEQATRLDASSPAAPFFAGVCHLLAGDAEAGSAALAATVALGETPYLEDALYFQAKAQLLRRDGAAARTALARLEAIDGERAPEVRALLERLASAGID
jgi:tetratricopeptide (TPR) repeat protein